MDIAFPGSNIISTVSTSAARSFFSPRIAHDHGEDLLYYHDFSDFEASPQNYRVRLLDLVNEEEISPEGIVTLATDEVHGESALQVTVDPSRLPEGTVLSQYQITVGWQMENPLKGSDLAAEELGLSVTPYVDSSTVPRDFEAVVYPSANSSQLGYLTDTRANLILAKYDNYQIMDTSMSAVDAESDTLTGIVTLQMGAGTLQGPVSMRISGYGIGEVAGEDSDYAPYALMSGTSMATPLATGSFARLAGLYPDESPLELRGRLVGAAEDIEPTYDAQGGARLTATDGRFSFETALDDDGLSANTWSIEVDPATGAAELHGRARRRDAHRGRGRGPGGGLGGRLRALVHPPRGRARRVLAPLRRGGRLDGPDPPRLLYGAGRRGGPRRVRARPRARPARGLLGRAPHRRRPGPPVPVRPGRHLPVRAPLARQ